MQSMQALREALDAARGHWPRIADLTGVDHSTIARIARGEITNPRLETFERLTSWLAVNPPPYILVSEQSIAQQ